MKKMTLSLVALIAIAASAAAEATPYTRPDTNERGFFLNRSDMEEAVNAQEEAAIFKKKYDELLQDIDAWNKWSAEKSKEMDALREENRSLRVSTAIVAVGSVVICVITLAIGALLR